MWAAIKSWFMADGQHRIANLVCSLVFLSLSFVCFFFEPQASTKRLGRQEGNAEKTNIVHKVITNIDKPAGISARTNVFHETVTTISSQTATPETSNMPGDSGGMAKWCEYAGLGLLILSAWMWHKELEIDSLFGVSARKPDAFPPQDPSERKDSNKEDVPPIEDDIKATVSFLKDDAAKKQAEHIVGFIRRRHATNVAMAARELGITHTEAETLLFSLEYAGVLRADGVPKATIYTVASSFENLTLDYVRKRVESEQKFISEQRFVRINQLYDVDSILTCEDRVFVVEAKHQRADIRAGYLENWCLQLVNESKEISDKPVVCILAIACSQAVFARVKQQTESMTLYGGKIPIQIMVLCEDELRKMRKG